MFGSLVLTVLLLFPMAPLCSVPQAVSCPFPEILDSSTAVQVLCSNPLCWHSGLVHPGCYYRWENKVVSFLTSSGGRGESTSVDSWVNSSLLTSQMWDHPLPSSFTACKCGMGSLNRICVSKESDKGEASLESSGSFEAEVNNDGDTSGVKVKINDDIYNGKESSEEKWEFVSRSRVKKCADKHLNSSRTQPKKDSKLKIEIANKESGNRTVKKKANSTNRTIHPTAADTASNTGPDPVLSDTVHGSYLHQMISKSAEGKRDSSGLIHCCSCHTVHVSLPHFIQHCKTDQHSRSQIKAGVENFEVADVNNDEGFNDLKREMQQLRKCLLELMKKSIDHDTVDDDRFEELRDDFEDELNRHDGALSVLAVKVQEMEEEICEMKKKLSICSCTSDNNEKDLDSCFQCFQDLDKKVEVLSEKMRIIESRYVSSHINVKTVCKEVGQDSDEFKLMFDEMAIRWVSLSALVFVMIAIYMAYLF